MSTSKLFKYAGVSTNPNYERGTRARFANDIFRVKQLDKVGHINIDIVELPHAMTKEDASRYLLEAGFDNGEADVKAAFEYELNRNAPRVPRAVKVKSVKPRAVKVKSVKTDAPSLESIAARIKAELAAKSSAAVESDLEDAPF